jgi:hypothetical protein
MDTVSFGVCCLKKTSLIESDIPYDLSEIECQEGKCLPPVGCLRRGIIPSCISVRTLIQGLKDFPDFGQTNTVEIRDRSDQAEQKSGKSLNPRIRVQTRGIIPPYIYIKQ